jgi:hypothetical protein
MLSRPISCGVTATVESMRSVELMPKFSPFDVLDEDFFVNPIVRPIELEIERQAVQENTCNSVGY